jgi:hypothetical protein
MLAAKSKHAVRIGFNGRFLVAIYFFYAAIYVSSITNPAILPTV